MKKVAFNLDHQHQAALFPIPFEALAPANHPVRVVSRVIDRLDISDIVSSYKGGGAFLSITDVDVRASRANYAIL